MELRCGTLSFRLQAFVLGAVPHFLGKKPLLLFISLALDGQRPLVLGDGTPRFAGRRPAFVLLSSDLSAMGCWGCIGAGVGSRGGPRLVSTVHGSSSGPIGVVSSHPLSMRLRVLVGRTLCV